jgi:hypothetical protein
MKATVVRKKGGKYKIKIRGKQEMKKRVGSERSRLDPSARAKAEYIRYLKQSCSEV